MLRKGFMIIAVDLKVNVELKIMKNVVLDLWAHQEPDYP
jgi:hypothetical protein